MFVHIQIYPNRGRYGAGSGFPCWTSLIVIVGALYALSRKPVVVKIFFIGSEPQFCNGFTHLPESKLNRNKSWNISSVNSRIWFNHFGDCETPKGRLAPNGDLKWKNKPSHRRSQKRIIRQWNLIARLPPWSFQETCSKKNWQKGGYNRLESI